MGEKPKTTSLIPPPSLRPSGAISSIRPNAGISRFVVKGLLDPQFIIIAIVSGMFEGITKAILEWREKRRKEREIKALEKKIVRPKKK